MFEWAYWGIGLAVLDVVLAGAVTIHAVLWKRDSRSVIGWVGLAWLAPLLGAFAYLCLGINRIQRRVDALNLSSAWSPDRDPELCPEDRQQMERFAHEHGNLIGLAEAGRRLSGLALLPGNRVEPLINGDQTYPAMMGAIEDARRSVALLSYIFDSDRVGKGFLKALIQAKDRGVQVRVLIDGVGCRYSSVNMVHSLQEAGIQAASFLPTRLPRLPKYTNLRNHRKILVVDGEVGFTGGTNIREAHCLSLQTSDPTQCLHFKVQGPVVSQLQEVFATDWAFATDEAIVGDDWFPPLSRAGTVWARCIEDGPDEHFEKLADIMAAALASAKERVRIVTPYFLPSPSLIQALNVAALRNVEVQIYLPSRNNIPLVHWAATAQLWQVLEKGCRVYYTAAPFDHTKLMIVDDIWTLIGSTNWDPRSLRLNFELNMECYDPPLAASVNEIVDGKAQSAREVTLEEVNERGLPTRLRDGLTRLLTPYL